VTPAAADLIFNGLSSVVLGVGVIATIVWALRRAWRET
jgi:hypothetical protein